MTVELIDDHRTYACVCGSVNFNLLLSDRIECSSCQKKLLVLWGQRIAPMDLAKKKVNAFSDNSQVVSFNEMDEPALAVLLSNMKTLQEHMVHVSLQMLHLGQLGDLGDSDDFEQHGFELSNASETMSEWVDVLETLVGK